MIIAILLILISFFFEAVSISGYLLIPIISASPTFFLLVLIHVLAALIFSFGMYKCGLFFDFQCPINWRLLCLTHCIMFPGLGFILSGITLLFLVKSKKGHVYSDYEKYIFYEYKAEEKYIDLDNVVDVVDEELEVRPLVDVLDEQDIGLRRGAINVMENLPKKDAVRLLRLSLQDNNIEVRYYAASTLSRIENELVDNIETAKREVERNLKNADVHLSLANAYEEYYECGILDALTARYYRDLALTEYQTVIELKGEDDVHVLNAIANIEVNKKNYDRALSCFKRVCELDQTNIFGNVGMIQVYYELGRVSEAMRRAQEVIGIMPPSKGPMRAIIEYWAT